MYVFVERWRRINESSSRDCGCEGLLRKEVRGVKSVEVRVTIGNSLFSGTRTAILVVRCVDE